MSCVMRADGAAFDVDGFSDGTSLPIIAKHRAGERRRPGVAPSTRSNINVEVSDADFEHLDQQIQDALAFAGRDARLMCEGGPVVSLRGGAAIVAGTLVAWACMVAVFGGWCWVSSIRNPEFVPEMGPWGAFVVFSALLTVFSVPAFLVLVCPMLLFLGRRAPHWASWSKAVVAAAALLPGVPVMIAVSGGWHDGVSDGVFIGCLFPLPAVLGARVVLLGGKPDVGG
jgi:hypothetical protein